MNLIDTHTHLYAEAFDEDRDHAIQKAIAVGVEHFFLPAIDATYIEGMFALEEKFPDHVHLMMGLHPTHVKENYYEELAQIGALFAGRNFSAVGEIGIDLYWDKSLLKQQQESFHIQIKWAKQHELPIVIHCRDAFDEVFEVLETHKNENLSGIFHCFTGTLEQAKKAIDLNLKLGIGGVVTFKNGKINQFLNEIPLTEIVLETDAPYLAPAPYRGKRNESAYLPIIAEKVADCYGLSITEIARQTTQNALGIFKNHNIS